MSAAIPRCPHCNGSVLAGSCIACGRSPEPERVSLGEALLNNAGPLADRGERTGEVVHGPRQTVPLSVSLERARRWARGELA